MIDLTKGHISYSMINHDNAWSVVDISTLDSESKVTYYEELLALALIQRAHQKDPEISGLNQDKVFPHIKHILEWLRTTDFYTSPASTKYHDACYGGLLNHTLEVYKQLVGLRSVPKFKDVVENHWWSAVFVVLVHDWCKIGRYESYLRNVKNDETGAWEKVPSFKIREDDMTHLGHGTQSLIMAMQVCNSKYTSLSFDEMAAIRWHMDNWDIGHYDEGDLAKCNEKIPLVRMVQFADQLAITTY